MRRHRPAATETVLIVDDHPDILSLMKAMLARSSYRVLTADSAVTALNVLHSNPQVDLVISEAVLPGRSGSALIGIVKQSFPCAAVMLTMAYTEELPDSAVPCLQKPFTHGTFINRVQEVLRKSREARQAARDGGRSKFQRHAGCNSVARAVV